jgi:thymidylate synthase (FAD)
MMKYSAQLIGYTSPTLVSLEGPEELIAYCARVSSGRPKEEWGADYDGLLRYCQRNAHWSVFEMADIVIEVEAPRDISRQMIRHRSFNFQEFSQRYSDKIEFTDREVRRQDTKNRQNSIDDMSAEDRFQFMEDCRVAQEFASELYFKWLDKGAAKECARVFLPEGLTMSRLMMKGNARSWLHYIGVRDDWGVTQQEHVVLARKIREVLKPVLPVIFAE